MDYRISVDISAPPDLVWSIITDVERWHEWTASVRGIRLLDKDKGPLRIGSRALVRQPKLLPAVWKVTALDPGRGFTWTTGAPATWIHAFHAVDPIPTGARVTLRVEFSGPLARVIARLTADLNNRYLAMEAAGLKQRSEDWHRGSVTG